MNSKKMEEIMKIRWTGAEERQEKTSESSGETPVADPFLYEVLYIDENNCFIIRYFLVLYLVAVEA